MLEKLIFYPVFGFVPPVLFLLIGWWGSYFGVDEQNIKWFALAGFIVGLIINVRYLSRWITNIYQADWWKLVLVFLFYQVGMFGFFMGVPVFNLIIPVVAGFYSGKRLKGKPDKGLVNKVAVFSSLVMLIVCMGSGWIALNDPFTASNIKGMLGLSFLPSQEQLQELILLGGIGLIISSYLLVWLGYKLANKLRYS